MTALADELERIAAVARDDTTDGERLTGVLAAEPGGAGRVYLCAFEGEGGRRTWLALDEGGVPLTDRRRVRDAVSITALCEVAIESAGGGRLEELRAQLVAVRMREQPVGIEEAEEAALALEQVVGVPPRLASPGYLDELGAATKRLEQALGTGGPSPFAEAMKIGMGSVEALALEVERTYRRPLP